VTASSQSLGSSDGTVVLTHGFLPLRLASNNQGWRVHTLNLHPQAAGQFLAAENVPRPLPVTAFGRSFCLAVSELTRSGGIKLNE
jgi:hypothetical protein